MKAFAGVGNTGRETFMLPYQIQRNWKFDSSVRQHVYTVGRISKEEGLLTRY